MILNAPPLLSDASAESAIADKVIRNDTPALIPAKARFNVDKSRGRRARIIFLRPTDEMQHGASCVETRKKILPSICGHRWMLLREDRKPSLQLPRSWEDL